MSKFLIFPPKDLEKIRAPKMHMRHFFPPYFQCQRLIKIFIFPPKNLEKVRAPKIRMRHFFPLIFFVNPC